MNKTYRRGLEDTAAASVVRYLRRGSLYTTSFQPSPRLTCILHRLTKTSKQDITDPMHPLISGKINRVSPSVEDSE
ncbi:hypothetical protein RRG08_000133 [Elysia crispata]|uniref:Uncharacterized protein n=1 Tax=Elysia crispata TaxID=231223 RepID=A0AAE1D5W1_9GAST|nr:hypothetical protein RRG08_000133 [Elysia crispata]